MRYFVKALTKIVVGGIVLGLIAIISFNCMETPLSPVVPSSQITLQVPLIDITKYISDVQGKSPGVTTDPSGVITYSASESSAPYKIDSIKLAMSPSGQQVGVGQFTVNGFAEDTIILANSISPSLSGTLPLLPAATFPIPAVSFGDTSTFDYVGVASGTLTLSITNNMPIPIDFPNPIVLHNNWINPVDKSTIASFSIPGVINPANSVAVPAVIDGKLLRGLLAINPIQLHTSGSSSPVTFTTSSGLSISFRSTQLITADSAAAVIPGQQLTSVRDSTIVVDDTVVVKNAIFSGGSFQLQINNHTGVQDSVYFIVKEALLNKTSFLINTILQGNTITTWNIPGNQFSIQTTPSQLGTILTFSVGIKSINSNNVKLPVSKFDFVRASIIPGPPLVVQTVTGKIKPQTIPINFGMKSGFSDITNLKAKITFAFDSLIARFMMSGGFPMDYNIMVLSKKGGQVLSTLPIVTDNVIFKRIYPGYFVIPISQSPVFNNFLSNSFPNVPDSFYVKGSVTLDPIDEFNKPNYYTIYDTTKIYPTLDVKLPFGAGIQNGIITQMTSIGKDAIPTDFTKAVGNGSITFTIINSIPVQIAFQSRLIRYNATTHAVIDTALYIPQDNTSYSILPAKYDTITQNVTASQWSTFTVTLNNAEMQKFNQSDSMFVRMFINTSNSGKYVKVKSTDKIRVFASGNINYTINKP